MNSFEKQFAGDEILRNNTNHDNREFGKLKIQQ